MNKIKSYIQDIIKNEIESHSINNWHGITKENLNQHLLLSPKLEVYIDGLNVNKRFKLWTVLEEYPEEKKVYTIFYDEKENEFGLGLKSPEGKLTFIGYYGGFIETLNGM